MSETETFGPCLVRKLKWGHGRPGPPSCYAHIFVLSADTSFVTLPKHKRAAFISESFDLNL